jgi:glucose-6-phosphate isomerase
MCGKRMTIEAAGLYLNYSKNRVTDEALKLLVHLAQASKLREPDRRHLPGRQN